MSADGPAEAAPGRRPYWFITGVVLFALGVAHLAFQLRDLTYDVYSSLPEPVLRWLEEPAGAPRLMRVHRVWWGLAAAATALSITRRERPALWDKVGLLILIFLAWLAWEFVLSIMGTF